MQQVIFFNEIHVCLLGPLHPFNGFGVNRWTSTFFASGLVLDSQAAYWPNGTQMAVIDPEVGWNWLCLLNGSTYV